MQDDNALGYLNRSLQYLFRPGNLLYCGALAAVFIALRSLGEARMEGVGTLNWFIIFALIVLFACKMLDSMQRLMHGLEQERVPLTTISKLPKNIAIDAAVAIAFCGTVVFLLQLMFTGDSRPTSTPSPPRSSSASFRAPDRSPSSSPLRGGVLSPKSAAPDATSPSSPCPSSLPRWY